MGGKRGDLVVAAFQIGPVGNQEAVEGLHAQHGRYQGAQPPQGNHGELLFQIIGGGELHRVIQQPRRLLLLQNTVLQRQADHAEAQQGNDENDDGFQHDVTKSGEALYPRERFSRILIAPSFLFSLDNNRYHHKRRIAESNPRHIPPG